MFRLFALALMIALPAEAMAQNLFVGSNFSGQSYNGSLSGQNRAPIALGRIIQGASTGTATTSSSGYTFGQNNYATSSYNNGASSASVPYSFNINPETAMRNRAQRDAQAQRNQIDTLSYLQNGGLDQTYAEEYKAYQEKLGLNSTKNAIGITKTTPTKKVSRVKYKNPLETKKITKPRRVFSSNY